MPRNGDESKAIRVTWRVSDTHKLNFFADPQRDCHCPALTASGSPNAPEAFFSYRLKPAGLYQVTWNAPVTNKLLFEAGIGRADGSWPIYRQPEVTKDDVSIVEQTTGVRYNSATASSARSIQQAIGPAPQPARLRVLYITGSHAFKAGLQLEESSYEIESEVGNTNIEDAFRNGVPVQLTQWATPFGLDAHNKDFAFYAQDQWTLQRLTLTYGVRYEVLQRLRAAAACQRHAQRMGARA